MPAPLTLGIDIGTTNVKASVLDTESLRVVAHASAEHPLFHPRPGWAEQEPDNYWRAAVDCIRACLDTDSSFADRIVRQVRYKQPKQYLEQVAAGAPLQEDAVVTRKDVGFEFMLNALRLTDGVPASLFAERTGYPLALVRQGLEAAEARGLIERDPAMLRPTARGRRFLNDLQQLFLP